MHRERERERGLERGKDGRNVMGMKGGKELKQGKKVITEHLTGLGLYVSENCCSPSEKSF